MSIIDRREFLVTSSTALAVLSAAPLARGSSRPALETGLVSIGFLGTASALIQRFLPSWAPTFIPAESVLSGDPTLLSTDARFRVAGYRSAGSNRGSEQITLDVLSDVPELGRKVGHYAWTSVVRAGRIESSRSAGFRVAVDPLATTDLAFERRPLAGSTENGSWATVRFSVNSIPGALSLNRGTYAFALLAEGQSAPDWRSVSLREQGPGSTPGGDGLLMDARGGEVGFAYLVLMVS